MRTDKGTLLRFAIVGVSVAAFYTALFVAFSRSGLAPGIANAIALTLAVIGQYIAQTAWTFRRPLALPDQIGRFATVIAAGYLFSHIVTAVVAPAAGFADWLAAGIVVVSLPVLNFVAFRLWVYAEGQLSDPHP
ncbi:MAG: GtrA family protein [Rubricella sp.]